MQLTKGAIGNLINRYRAVLKKCHLLNVFGSLAVAGMLVMGGAAAAGAADDVALEGQNNYNSEPTSEVNNLMGGWLVKEGTTTEATGDITLDVKGGTISEIIGGSYVKTNSDFSATLTHGTITTVIDGETTSAEFVVGGSKIANSENASLKTGDISLTINSGAFGNGKLNNNDSNYELVTGGNYLKADQNAMDSSKAEAGHITVNINSGTFNTSVVGGSTAHVYDGNGEQSPTLTVTDASTSVTITGGTFGQSYSTGGGAINLDPSVIGGGLALVQDGITETVSASSTITGNTLVTIAQAEDHMLTINDKVLGGSLAQGKGTTVTVGTEGQNNTSGVVVENVTSVGDLVGGNMAEGGTATLNGSSSVQVAAGTVKGDVMGGSYVRGSGTVTTTGNTGVVFSAGNAATVSQAEYLVGGDKVLASSEGAQSTGTISGTSSVTVNGDASVTTGAVVGGSFSRVLAGTDNRAASATVASSVVTINGGTSIAGVVGGGLAEYLSGNGSATSTVTNTSAVYVKGGNLTNIVYTKNDGGSNKKASSYAAVVGAGFATGEQATASVENSVVVIDGADTLIKGNEETLNEVTYDDKDNAKVVAGGVATNGGTVNVTNTALTMNDGTVTGDLIGGNLIEGSGEAGDITSTSVALTGGTLDGEVMGGSYIRGSNESAIHTTTVLVSGGELRSAENKAQYVLGGGKAFVYANEQAATLNIGTTNVTISDSVKVLGGGVIGGSLAKGTADGTAKVNVTKANTTILGGTQIAGVVGGGVAENYDTSTGEVSSSVKESQLTISGGAIDALRYGAQISADATSAAAVVGGGVASFKGSGGTVTSSVTTANTTINGGTITGHVIAGGMADGTSATAGVEKANLSINGGDIKGDVYAGGAALGGGEATVDNFDVRIMGGTITGNVVAGNYTGEEPTNTSLMAQPVPFNSGSSTGSITIGGDANIGGAVTVNDGVTANVIIDGTDATVDGSYQGNADSTLTFQNYNTDFNKVATGFGTLEAAAGSNVTLDNLSTGAYTGEETGFFGSENGNDITVTGEGTVTAKKVNVDGSKTLNVGTGDTVANLQITDSLTTTGTLAVNNLGTATLNKGVVFENDTVKNGLNTTVNTGGVLKIAGLDDMTLTKAQLSTLKGLAKDGGLLDVGAAELSVDKNEDGTVNYADVSGITSDTLQGTTVAVDDEQNTGGISGGFQAVKLTGDDKELKAKNTLGLAGSQNGGALVMDKDGNVADLRVGGALGSQDTSVVTLGLEDANNKGTVGTVTMNAGADKTATLNVIGAGAAEFTIGDIRANESTNTINVQGATLNTGNITTEAVTSPATLDAMNITNGTVKAAGDAEIKDVTLDNGLLQAVATTGDTPAGGDITIDGDLSGQGAVVADKTLTLTNGYTGTEGDDLILQATTLDTGAINSTDGDLTIAATNLVTANGAATILKDDTLVADNVDLGDALTASGASLVQVKDFGSYDASEGRFTSGALDQAVSVQDTSLMAYGADLAQAQQAVAETGHTGAAYYAGKTLTLANGGSLTVGTVTSATTGVAFGNDSLLVVNGTAMNGQSVFTGPASGGATATVADGAKLHVDNAIAGNFTVFDSGFDTTSVDGWAADNVTTDSAMLNASYNDNNSKVTVGVNDAHTVFPNLSHELATAVNTLYDGKLNSVDSADMGVRFLSRATNDHYLGADKQAAASTIESAARMAFAGAVPQMTKMASDAGTNAVVNRLGFANPADGAQAMNAEGKIVDRNTTGFALWIAPLWQNQHGWGMEAGNLDYGFNGNLGGVSLGADYTFENAIRAGITFNIGGGYAESSGGDLNSTENRMTFWGLGAYAGWNYENFGLMADVSYTSTWNDLEQDMDGRMGMGDLEADVQATAISAGLRAEYKLETSVLDIIPHIGVRYMSLNTWGYDVDTNGGTVLEGDGFHQDIWTFPIGVTFSKDFTLDSGWFFKPSVDFSVIPAAGDIKAKQDVAFTGLPGTYEVETQMMDYLTWQGGVGIQMGNDNLSFGVNYTLQAGQNTTGHGVFGSFRYEF